MQETILSTKKTQIVKSSFHKFISKLHVYKPKTKFEAI